MNEDALKNLLATLCVANSSSTSIGTVSDEIAFVSDLVECVGPVVAYKALAKHINDFTTTPTYGSTTSTAVYSGQTYTDRNASDILLQIGNKVMSPGQEIALCMFIRANVPLRKMNEIISHANLIAYINYNNSSNNADSTISKPTIEASGSDFTTKLVSDRKYQYDVTRFFSAVGESSYKFPLDTPSDEVVYIISMSQLYIKAAASPPSLYNASTSTPVTITNLDGTKAVFLKMVTELAPGTHVLRGPDRIISTYNKPTAATGYISAGNYHTASSGAYFTTTSTTSPVSNANSVFAYITSGFTTTVSSLLDDYYASTQTVTFKINKYVAPVTNGNSTVPFTFEVNGDGLIGANVFAGYSVAELKTYGLTALQIKDLGKPLDSIVAGYTGYTPSQAIRDGWSLTAVRAAFTPLKALTVNGTAFNARPSVMGVATETRFVTLTTPNLLDDLVAMYRSLNTVDNTNAFVAAVNAKTASLPGYIAPTVNNRIWLTTNKLPESVARWLYDTVTEVYAVDVIMGVMSIPALTSILSGATVNTGLTFADVVLESEFAQYDTVNKVITSGLTPRYLIDRGLTPKDARYKYSWPLPLLIDNFPVDRLLEKTLPDGTRSITGVSTISITEALIGREWVTNSSPAASVNKSFDNIPYKTIAKHNSEADIIAAIAAYMRVDGNGLDTANIGKFLSALHLPFAVVNRLIGTPYGSGTTLPKVKAADVAGLKNYTKAQRRSVFNGLNDAVTSLVAGLLDTGDFVALGWPVSDWVAYASDANPTGVSITISLRDVLGAFEPVSVFDSESFIITGLAAPPADLRAIYHTKEDREALVRLFTTAPGRPPLPPAEITRLALGPLEDLDEITL